MDDFQINTNKKRRSISSSNSRWSINTQTHLLEPFDSIHHTQNKKNNLAFNQNDENSEQTHSEYKFDNQLEYWLVLLGYAVGYGSFWRFPYLVYSCG